MALAGSEIERIAGCMIADYDGGSANELFAQRGTDWLTIEDAYSIQRKVAELRRRRGELHLGYKVGCLSPAIQKQFGLIEPVRGYVWQSEMVAPGSSLSYDPSEPVGRRFVNLAIEGEIALRLAQGICPGISDSDLLASIEGWFPVIELHNYVYRGPIPTSQELVAGNAMHAGFVGAPASALRLSDLSIQSEIEIEVDGDIVESKRVAEIPGGPLGSVRWLASSLARSGETLEAGNIILTGSPGQLIPIAGPRKIVVTCQNLEISLTVKSSVAT
jgi:2-keto-4-pentenoate hydratase